MCGTPALPMKKRFDIVFGGSPPHAVNGPFEIADTLVRSGKDVLVVDGLGPISAAGLGMNG
ncbi:MAG: hypothetical protein CM15mP62_28900 [Rhodospirillaceae bacterium]|nr:MAG: hypothetical protein CM15mP62_28900 [Rhodospirillaceae bacterium]